jgi:hypothetical protein
MTGRRCTRSNARPAIIALVAVVALVVVPAAHGAFAASTPTIGVGDASVYEGDSGTRQIKVPITLSDAMATNATVRATVTGTGASPNIDFKPITNKLVTVKAGKTRQVLSVNVIGDVGAEGDETVAVALTAPSAGTVLGRASGTGTIRDDDGSAGLRVFLGDVSVIEGDSGGGPSGTVAQAQLTLNTTSASPVTVVYSTINGSAGAPGDYTARLDKSVVFKPGQFKKAITVKITRDTVGENDEQFTIEATATGAGLGDATSTLTILDDDSIATTTALASAPNPSTYGDGVTLTATVTAAAPAPAPGAVEFFDGSTSLGSSPLSGGTAQLVTSTLTTGVHELHAEYLGSGNYVGSTSPDHEQTVIPIETSTSLTGTPNPSIVGNDVTLTADVTAPSGTPTGDVTFFDGASPLATVALASGTAQVVISTLSVGPHLLTAAYQGSDTHAASTSPDVSHDVQEQPRELWVWGDDALGPGQLGDGGNTNKSTPEQIGTTPEWLTLDAGALHSVGIKTDGTLWAWGDNSFSELGDGTSTDRLSPVHIGTATNWVAVEAGGARQVTHHTLGLRRDGSLWAWGGNGSGELGVGDFQPRTTPTRVGTDTDWMAISAGSQHSLAIKRDGSLWAWGNGTIGQLGTGFTTFHSTPVRIGTDSDWVAVEAGQSRPFLSGAGFSVALKSDGSLWTWGENFEGQLGLGDTTPRLRPTRVGTATTWASISAGDDFTMALRTNGTLWGWGRNETGAVGIGTTTPVSTPTQVGAATDWRVVAAAGIHSLAIEQDGTLWSWGANASGQLGDGTVPTNRSTPAQVGTDTDWIAIFGGHVHSLALRS